LRGVRSRIEAMLPAATADIARFARLHRERIRAASRDEDDRVGSCGSSIIDGPISQLIAKNRWQAAEQALAAELSAIGGAGSR
jgi:uroporphyrin-III C-methyltransferase/precorrin-2 dehydrogenase/sirohydrochlorin ferrochelatase